MGRNAPSFDRAGRSLVPPERISGWLKALGSQGCDGETENHSRLIEIDPDFPLRIFDLSEGCLGSGPREPPPIHAFDFDISPNNY